jgi:hypothetical protein
MVPTIIGLIAFSAIAVSLTHLRYVSRSIKTFEDRPGDNKTQKELARIASHYAD